MSDTAKQVIPLSKPDVTEAEIEAVVQVLRTDRLSIGPHLEAFEAALARRAGRKYGIGVNSGTSGLHLCVKSLGIAAGEEVITTPFSFIATTNAILFENATPVFVDIDPQTYNMDPEAIEPAITPRTRAILPVEVFGNTAHFDAYEQIARRNGLRMIEDCCEALGGYLAGRPAGNFGDCGVFGFYPNKQITTGEGGMIVTDSDQIAQMCRALRNQGRIDDSAMPHPILGYNYRMGELTAALGQGQMTRLEEILDKRRRAAAVYSSILADIEEIHLPNMAQPDKAAWFVYVVRLDDSFSAEQRDELVALLGRRGVSCKTYFSPIHLQPFIRERLGTKEGDYPVTERVASQTLVLPFFTNITPDSMMEVKKALGQSLAELKGHSAARAAGVAARAKAPDSVVAPLRDFYRTMVRIRLFEEAVSDLLEAGEVKCPCHLYIGQEAVAAGVCAALDREDYIWGTHRSHGHFLAKGGSMRKMMAEILGRSDGCSMGRGGSMHLFAMEVGMPGTVPIVAATIPLAVGAGLACKMKRDRHVSVSFFGDGATEEGHFHESVNLASLYKLPVIFICENNLYSSHMHILQRRTRDNLYEIGSLYGIPGIRLDGNNVREVYEATAEAVARARGGEGPSLLECRTYRWRGHVGPAWDMDVGVQRRDELKQWMPRCPVARARRELLAMGVGAAELDAIDAEARKEVTDSVEFAHASPLPPADELTDHVFFNGKDPL